MHGDMEKMKSSRAPVCLWRVKLKRASEALEKAAEGVTRCRKEKEAYFINKRCPGRPPDFDKPIEEARDKENDPRQCLQKAEEHQKQMKDAIKGISEAYHPSI